MITPADVVLSRTNPGDGKHNPYRTRWYEHDGVVFEVESDRLDGLWMVHLDLDLIFRLADSAYLMGAAHSEFNNRIRAWIPTDDNPHEIAFNLAEARDKIVGWVNGDDWPRMRDAYVALRKMADGR